MHIAFFDYQGILLDHPVPQNTTVNGEYYETVLRTCLRPAIRKKRPALLAERPILLHDNARPHMAKVVTDLMHSYGWEILEHPSYSPDLSPCDFFLFGLLKSKLRGHRFETEEAVNQATRQALKSVAKGGCVEFSGSWSVGSDAFEMRVATGNDNECPNMCAKYFFSKSFGFFSREGL